MNGAAPTHKVVAGVQPPLAQLALPYAQYSDEDIAQRFIYVEASRGCPFKCEFCLSALDKTAWPFELDVFMAELELRIESFQGYNRNDSTKSRETAVRKQRYPATRNATLEMKCFVK